MTENYLSYTTIKDITSTRSQYLSLLVELGFVNRKLDDSCNKNAENWPLIRGIIAGAFYPQVARIQYPDPKYFKSSSGSIEIDPDARQIKFWIKSDGELPAARVFIHPCQFFSMIIIRISFWTRIIRTFFPKSRLMMVP